MNELYPLAPVREGELLAGKYCVERVLGVGGMGVVVAARHVHLGQQVALKFLLPDACQNRDAVGRFLREARACVRMQGEHVTRVSDVGTLETGAPYMVMEYLQGVDLEQVIGQRGMLPVQEAVGYVLQVCEAIAEAHGLGIIHRDLKPRNLFLTQRPDGSPLVKVLDFGISKIVDPMHQDANLTATTMVLGSPLYMSPEQVRSAKSVDTRTDIWSLGVILFQLLTGRGPFDATTASGLLAAIVADPPSSLRSLRPDVPPEFELVIMRCIEKDLSRRTATVGQLARELAPFAGPTDQISVERILRLDRNISQAMPAPKDEIGSTRRLTAAAQPRSAGEGTGTVNAWSESGSKTSNRRWRARVGGAGVLALVAVVILVVARPWSSDRDQGTHSAGSAVPGEAPSVVGGAPPNPSPSASDQGTAAAAEVLHASGPSASSEPSSDQAPSTGELRRGGEPVARDAPAVRPSSSAAPVIRAHPSAAPRPGAPAPPRKRDRARELFDDIN